MNDLTDIQVGALSLTMTRNRAAYSMGRQGGKTHLGVKVATLASVINGERVVYLSGELKSSQEAFRRTESQVTSRFEEFIEQTRKSFGQQSIRLRNGGSVNFCSYGQNGALRGREFDRLILDDYSDAVHGIHVQAAPTIAESRVLYLPMGRELDSVPGYGEGRVPTIWHGMDEGDDLNSEDVWRKAIPDLGGRIPIEYVRRMREEMPDDLFADEVLNRKAVGV